MDGATSERPARGRWRRRLLALALGPILALALLEAGLWVVAVFRPEARLATGEGRRTILCVGDSNTFGVHLERDESYPGQLQALLDRSPENPWRVLNAGYPGRNSAEVRAQLAEQLATYHPEIVLCWVGVNDTWSIAMRQLWDTPDREEEAGLGERILQGSRVAKLARMLVNRLHESDAAPEEEERKAVPPELVRERLRIDYRRIRAICEAQGARLVMADYPIHIDYTERVVNGALHEIARDSGTPLVPLHRTVLPAVYALAYERTMFSDYHANRRGNHEVARQFLLALMDLGLLERRPEWTAVPPLWKRLVDWPVRAVEASAERVTVLLHWKPGASYSLRLLRLYALGGDKTQRTGAPEPSFDALSRDERRARGLDGSFDEAGNARVEITLPPEPEAIEPGEHGATWLGWRVAARWRLPDAPPPKHQPLPVDVLLDPAVIGAGADE